MARKEDVPRGRGGLFALSLCFFKTRDTLLSVVDQRSTRPVPRINSRSSSLERELRSSARNKNRRSVSSSQITRSTNFVTDRDLFDYFLSAGADIYDGRNSSRARDSRKISIVNRPSFSMHDGEKIGREEIDFFYPLDGRISRAPGDPRLHASGIARIETSYLRVIADY